MSESKINIIGGNAYSTTGGIQAVNRLLVRELGSAGLLRCAFFLWDTENTATPDGKDLRAQGLVRFYGLQKVKFVVALFRQAIRHPEDMWLCTHVNYGLLGLLMSWGLGGGYAIMLHAAELDDEMGTLKGFALRRAGRIYAVSEYTKKKAIKLGVHPERVQVLLNAVDDPCAQARPKVTGALQPTILFVGRMDERYKGQMELLDTMNLLRSRLPDLRLVFVGGGRTLEEWHAEAHRRDLGGVVEFTGRISDEQLAQRYATATLFAMPSENEGFGLVYAEAMAYRLPCIGSDRDAAREVIVHGETGYCVPAGNSTSLAEAVFDLVKSPELRSRMGEAGRRRFLEQFTTANYRKRLIAEMNDWCAKHS